MKDLSIISSLIFAVLTAIYCIFGKDDSVIWSGYYFVNIGLYICLLLVDKIWHTKSLKKISMLVAAIGFQVLLMAFEVYLIIWCSSKYYEMVNSVFWSIILFVVIAIYILTNKILDK